jgi:hypothetical protein
VLILLVDYATGDAHFRNGGRESTGANVFGMIVAVLIVVPGAVIGWKVRGRELNLWTWLSVTVPYWLAVAAISFADSPFPKVILPAAMLCGGLSVLLLVMSERLVAPERRRRKKAERAELAAVVEKQKDVQGSK